MSNLTEIRNRFIPILGVVVDQYSGRVPAGYPNVVDDVDGGMVGIELDPNFAVFVTEDSTGLFAEVYKRDPRIDARATAGRQKYAGTPVYDRRPLDETPSDQHLRNLVGELKSAFNTQPGLIYITED
ncbi:MAG: hypothetical protein KC435_04710 [Thermomicrobiales bacterium]|nr:hypothetical protein [Thermomicrobiales bacterium]